MSLAEFGRYARPFGLEDTEVGAFFGEPQHVGDVIVAIIETTDVGIEVIGGGVAVEALPFTRCIECLSRHEVADVVAQHIELSRLHQSSTIIVRPLRTFLHHPLHSCKGVAHNVYRTRHIAHFRSMFPGIIRAQRYSHTCHVIQSVANKAARLHDPHPRTRYHSSTPMRVAVEEDVADTVAVCGTTLSVERIDILEIQQERAPTFLLQPLKHTARHLQLVDAVDRVDTEGEILTAILHHYTHLAEVKRMFGIEELLVGAEAAHRLSAHLTVDHEVVVEHDTPFPVAEGGTSLG